MSEAEWQINKQLDSYAKNTFFNGNQVDCRSILHLFKDEEIKRVASELHHSGYRGEPKYEKMTVDILGKSHALTEKQKNALITFIMYSNQGGTL